MNFFWRFRGIFRAFASRPLCTALLAVLVCGTSAAEESRRLETDWSFHLGDMDIATATAGRSASGWRTVHLPHDWSIEAAPTPNAPSAGGGGFFETGIGWYRQTIAVPKAWDGTKITLEFEGVSGETRVWLNGVDVGTHVYAYTPFTVDLTPHLRPGRSNLLLVRVDNSRQPNSRWYTGSGLYRHVHLQSRSWLHVEPHSLVVQTLKLHGDGATLQVDATLRNDTEEAKDYVAHISLLGPDGAVLAMVDEPGTAAPQSTRSISRQISLSPAPRWSPEAPRLCRAVAGVTVKGKTLDLAQTPFGIRTIQVSAQRGLQINGQTVKLFGGNVHHDNGPLGAAAFDRAEERKVQLLKAAGLNAVRTAHNPPSRAFLDACDRLGLLVLNEAFDGWAKKKTPRGYSEHFTQHWRADLEAFVRQDRNHPSVVMWSIGNEVYERGSESGAALSAEMAALIRTLDTTRPITVGLNGLGKGGDWTKLDRVFAPLEVAGYNYEFARHVEDHVRLPQRVILGTESYVMEVWSTRTAVLEHPHIIGDFVWSALDYLGEAGIGRVYPSNEKPVPHWEGVHYPWHGAACGDIDLVGHRKPISHYRNIAWGAGERLYMAVKEPAPDGQPWNLSAWASPPLQASWTWPGQEGKELDVEVFSSAPAVRLYLGGRLIGEKATGPLNECRAVFKISYEPGELRAETVEAATTPETFTLRTASAPASLHLVPDRRRFSADGQDLVFVTIEVRDKNGVLNPQATAAVRYTVRGPATIQGIGSADLTSTESYQQNPRKTFRGRALVALRSTGGSGKVTLRAEAPGIKPAELTLQTLPR